MSSEWFNRPDDERYLSLDDLWANVKGRSSAAAAVWCKQLAEAMQGAIVHAEEITSEDAPRILAILYREGRLVLAGATYYGGVAWCHPVSDAAEARAVVSEASQGRRVGCAEDAVAKPKGAEAEGPQERVFRGYSHCTLTTVDSTSRRQWPRARPLASDVRHRER